MNPAESQFAATEAMRKYMTGGGADPRYGPTSVRPLPGSVASVEVDARGRVLMFDRAQRRRSN